MRATLFRWVVLFLAGLVSSMVFTLRYPKAKDSNLHPAFPGQTLSKEIAAVPKPHTEFLETLRSEFDSKSHLVNEDWDIAIFLGCLGSSHDDDLIVIVGFKRLAPNNNFQFSFSITSDPKRAAAVAAGKVIERISPVNRLEFAQHTLLADTLRSRAACFCLFLSVGIMDFGL